MRSLNHKRNAIRLTIVVFWLLVIGLFYTAYSNLGNAPALSWITWLVYFVGAIVALYAGAVLSQMLWNSK